MSAVTDHLSKRGVLHEVIPHERAYTSIAEARAMGMAADEVVKTLVLHMTSGYALAVVPGSKRLDMKRVHHETGDKRARLATEEELERDFPGYELGAIPPLGGLLGIAAYVDPSVLDHETVVFAAGTQTESVKARSEDLFSEGSVHVVHIARDLEEDLDPALR